MKQFKTDRPADRLKGSLVLLLVLFAALVISGGPDEATIHAHDIEATRTMPGGYSSYYTFDGD